LTRRKLGVALFVVSALAVFFLLDLGRYLSLETFRDSQAAIDAFYRERTALTVGAYFGTYVLVAALSLPGAAVMTLVGGAIFGLLPGIVIVSFASTIGATLAFLLARFLFRDAVQSRFGSTLRAVNEGVERDGARYLFLLRLVPVFPFFVINLVLALTPMKALTFFWVSQIGMLPGTAVYVNAGTQLAQIDSLGGILSPGLIGAFALLGLFPFLARGVARRIEERKVLKGHKRPRHFDRNLLVIGAGSAGLVTAYIAAAVKAKVTLIEKDAMGGDCLNTGCVPSKALIRTAGVVSLIGRHRDFGIREASSSHDFGEVMDRVQRVIRTIEPHDSVERYEGLGVEVIQGTARITDPWTVEVDGRTLTARHLVIATGARPLVPDLPGLEATGYLTSETVWGLRENPGRLLVIGGGAVGCELAQAFQRLGARVTLAESLPRLLTREDPDVSDFVAARLRSEGVDVRTEHPAVRFEVRGETRVAIMTTYDQEEVEVPFDTLLLAAGREARVDGFGLEEVGVTLKDGRIETDAFLRTRVPSIYACGDCVGPHQFTHAASHQAWHAAVNTLFSNPVRRFRVDHSLLPATVYTDPEVARVGLTETRAREKGVEVQVTRYDLAGQDRAITEESALGFVKVLTPPGKDRILGAAIVGAHAGDLISEFTLAMKHRIGLNGILGTIHPYPTLAEANKAVAGRWKRDNAPERLLAWVARYHAWRR